VHETNHLAGVGSAAPKFASVPSPSAVVAIDRALFIEIINTIVVLDLKVAHRRLGRQLAIMDAQGIGQEL
jgi:hypothetical protein